jgi:hypothetical protein
MWMKIPVAAIAVSLLSVDPGWVLGSVSSLSGLPAAFPGEMKIAQGASDSSQPDTDKPPAGAAEKQNDRPRAKAEFGAARAYGYKSRKASGKSSAERRTQERRLWGARKQK